MLPLDDERKLYLTVWLSFLSESLNMPELQPLCRNMYEDLHEIIRKSVQLLFDFGIVRPDIDFPFEVERLYALVDGLCLHCLTDSAEEALSAADSVLTRHLEKLCIILNGKIDYPVHNLKQ